LRLAIWDSPRARAAHEKGLATGEVFRGADLAGLVAVDDIEFQGWGEITNQKVTVRHLPEMAVA
jgi:hypothetical protein